MSELFDELPLWSAPFGLKLLEYVDYKPGITALDIGCGAGFPLLELAMRLGKTTEVYGIDPDSTALSLAEHKAAVFGITNIVLIQGVAEEIPLGDQSIDLIVSNNGINNVSDITRVLTECARVTKSGGQFVLSMNLDSTFREFYSTLEEVLSEMKMFDAIERMQRHIYEKRRPVEEMVHLLHEHGFMINEVRHDEFSYKFTDAAAMFAHHFIKTAFMPSWTGLLPQDQAQTIYDEVMKRMDERAHDTGKFTLTVPFALINSVRTHNV
jgi:arsenite methyltransferase